MLHLHISSTTYVAPGEIGKTVCHDCSVTYVSSIVKGRLEHGYQIQIYDIRDSDIQDMWRKLTSTYNLNCAFVNRPNEYMGCIKNWPNMFRESMCPKL